MICPIIICAIIIIEQIKKETTMNKDTIAGDIKIFTGQVKKQWALLTDDDLKYVEGRLDLLAGQIQKRYGIAKEEASKQVQKWADEAKAGLNA